MADERTSHPAPRLERYPIGGLAVIMAVTLVCALALKAFVVDAYRIPSGSMERTLLPGDLILVNKLSYGLRFPSSLPFVPVSFEPSYLLPLGNVRRGDVAVFELHNDGGEYIRHDRMVLVKRIVGLPGDSVEIRYGTVFVNGREMISPATVRRPTFEKMGGGARIFPEGRGFTEWEYGPVRVPAKGDRVDLRSQPIADWYHILHREGQSVDSTEDGTILLDGIASDRYVLKYDYFFVLGDYRENSTDSRMFGFICAEDVVGEGMIVYWSSQLDSGGSRMSHPFSGIRWSRVGQFIR